MKDNIFIFSLVFILFTLPGTSDAQNIYELRKLTEDDWIDMTTEERLRALSTANKHEPNQTFLGNFGRHQDLYRSWGYEYYEQEDRYENYAFRNYESYNVIEERRRRWSYNEFGDRIARMGMTDARIWRELYSGDGTYEVHMPYNYINSMGRRVAYTDGVWVAREGTDDWAVSITGAGALRTSFTPLTLALPNMDGVSIDFQSATTDLKLITTAPLGAYSRNNLANPVTSDLVRRGGVMLRGGRFRRKFGVLTLGATYVTSYGVQGNRERGSEWRGTVSNMKPTPIMVAVRFMDDSPTDGEVGAIVYNVRLKINGRYRDEIIPQIILDDVTRDQISAITDKYQNRYVNPSSDVISGAPTYDYFNITERIPKYADFMYLNDLIQGANADNVEKKYSKQLSDSYFSLTEQGGKPIQTDGYDTAVYLFDLKSVTDKVNRIEATATVGNDYHIQSSMIFTMESRGDHDTYGQPVKWYQSTYWRTVAQAEGNIKDNSNVRTVSFDFGFQVASAVYGFDADLNYKSFKIKGEIVTNTNYYMFPDASPGTGTPSNIVANQPPRTGHRFTKGDNAYYITTEKNWDKFGFAGEIFKMGENFKPWLDYFNYPAEDAFSGLNSPNARNTMSRIAFVEDNDDDDNYPDTMLTKRTMDFRIPETEDPDGVFPGNDTDNDGLPDNNRNNNIIPDYDEPFFMFDVDPDEFVFGNDYNNNTIPDFREDDMKMDTPYDLDRQGHHFFFRYIPQKSVNLIAGTLKTRGVGTSGSTNDDYFKFVLDYNLFDIGKLFAEYRYERIQDNIRDPYIQVERAMNESYLRTGSRPRTANRYGRELYFDELEYRNSKVNRLFIDSKIRAVPSITLENHVKFERNDQIEGIMYDRTYQQRDILTTLAMVNKIVYTKQWGNWVFSPGVKYRFYKKARSESLQPLDHYMMRIPLVMLKYVVSRNTDIALGMQGIPGFPFRYTDFVQSHNDYRLKIYRLQLQNRTTYFGYKIWASVGITLDRIEYDESYRQFEEFKSSSTFVKVSAGW